MTKFQYASCLVASLAWLIRDQGDAAGLVVCNDTMDITVPASASDRQLYEIIRVIESVAPEGSSEIGALIPKWATRSASRQLVVIASDLFGDEYKLNKSLTDLRQYGHEVIVFQICDRDEIDFPFVQMTEFVDMESGKDTTLDAELFREGYLKQFASFVNAIKRHCLQSSIEFSSFVTDQSLGNAIGKFLNSHSRNQVSAVTENH